ncbi:MAG: hypothetical protein ACLVEJ_01030 [Parabacteroides sp.]
MANAHELHVITLAELWNDRNLESQKAIFPLVEPIASHIEKMRLGGDGVKNNINYKCQWSLCVFDCGLEKANYFCPSSLTKQLSPVKSSRSRSGNETGIVGTTE